MTQSLLKLPLVVLFLLSGLTIMAQTEFFIMTWQTDNPGTSSDTSITIPTNGSGYNYDVDWNYEGSFDADVEGATGTIEYDYGIAGTYTVAIRGAFPRIYFNNGGDSLKLLSIIQWGNIAWSSMERAFFGCNNLNVTATDTPDLTLVTDVSGMFRDCKILTGTSDFNDWNVSGVENMDFMFMNCENFNQNLNNWNTSNVTSMAGLFFDAISFNGNISSWNVSSVDDMNSMFRVARAFNQDISSWNVSNVVQMRNMFKFAIAFNQNLGSWNVGNVKYMNNMFEGASNFDQNLGSWNITNLETVANMFNDSGLSFSNYDNLLTGWSTDSSGADDDDNDDIPSGLNLGATGVYYCIAVTERDLLMNTHSWSISDAGISPYCGEPFIMKWETTSPNEQIIIPTYNESVYHYNVDWNYDGTFDIESSGMTGNASYTYPSAGTHTVAIRGNFPQIYFNLQASSRNKIKEVTQWGDIEWTSMDRAFYGCSNLDVTATDSPDLTLVTSFNRMFRACTNLVGTSEFNNWDVSGIEDMDYMFIQASNFDQNLGGWDISSLEDARFMFNSSGLSSNNYDNLLIGWNSLDSGETQVPENINFNASGVTYCTAATERSELINSKGWSISDSGQDTACLTYTFDNTWSPSDPNGVSTVTNDIVIQAGDVVISANTSCKQITVAAGAGLTINSGITLTVASGMTMESTSTSYSSLILNGIISGDVEYRRHVNDAASTGATTGNNDLISPPLSGLTFGEFRAANTNIHSGILGGNSVYLFGPFNNTSGTYEIYSSSNDGAILSAGKGYRTGSNDSGTFSFTGTIQTGEVTIPVDMTQVTTISPWYLIGNPYPSYMKAVDFIEANSGLLDENSTAIYGYDGQASDGWTIYNLATESSRLIAPGQGFFIKAGATANGDISFTSALRSTGNEDDFVIGRSESALQYLKLGIETTANAYTTDFYFNENASAGLDPGYDASLWSGVAPSFALYSHLVEDNTGVPLALQALNTEDLYDIYIPLGVNGYANVPLTFDILDATIPDHIDVYLEDTQANTMTLLNEGTYEITPAEDLNGTGRFYLGFQDTSLSATSPEWDALKLFTDQQGERLVVQGQFLEATDFSLYDLQGRLVLKTVLAKHIHRQYVDASKLRSGVYIVELYNGHQRKTQKVIWH